MKSNGEKQVGFIAQDIQKTLPELVSGKEGDMTKGETLGMSYGNLTAVLTKAIQEQQVQIEELKAENQKLKNKTNEINELKAEMVSIKAILKNAKTSDLNNNFDKK
jgi:hypothetical protein